jgi:hypothetical protein
MSEQDSERSTLYVAVSTSAHFQSCFRVLTEIVEDIFRFHELELIKELTDYYERRPD